MSSKLALTNPLSPGDELEGYTLQHLLGQGSSGFVWSGRAVSNPSEVVVIKAIPLSGWRLEEYEREVLALTSLHHPNLLKLYKHAKHGRTGLLVTQQMDSDLLEFLDSYSAGEAECRMMFRQILAGVGHMHDLGFAHMDLKPENILIQGTDQLVVADMGSSFQWDPMFLPWKSGSAGTSFYCAPEVKSGRPYLADKADIWSLAITLHVMATGFWPYLGQDEKEVLNNAKKGRTNLACQHLSASLHRMLTVMLLRCPQDRPTVQDLLQHEWFHESEESEVQFTPRSYASDEESSLGARMSATSFSTANLSDPFDSTRAQEIQGVVLPELAFDGLKSPRAMQMYSPRMMEMPGGDHLIRPSPRRNNPAPKQTKLGKLLHTLRKGKVNLPGRAK